MADVTDCNNAVQIALAHYNRYMNPVLPSKEKIMFAVGQRCSVIVFSSARHEIYECTIVELMGVVGARVQIDGDRIIRVCQSQLKHF